MATVTDINPGALRIYPWLAGVPHISEQSFAWEEHEADNSFILNADDNGKTTLPDGWIPIGWADGSKIPYRKRSGLIAVKFMEDCREFWCHV